MQRGLLDYKTTTKHTVPFFWLIGANAIADKGFYPQVNKRNRGHRRLGPIVGHLTVNGSPRVLGSTLAAIHAIPASNRSNRCSR